MKEEDKREFLQEELQYVYKIREDAIRQTNLIEMYVVILTGLIWSWLFSIRSLQGIGLWSAWYLPLILNILAVLRVLGLNQMIEYVEDYILKVEKEFDLKNDGLGWNHFLKKEKNGRKTFIGISAWVFWVMLIVICAFMPILVNCF